VSGCGGWDFGRDAWDRSDGCYLRCAWRTQSLEFDELRQQVRDAVGRLSKFQIGLDSIDFVQLEVDSVIEALREAVGDE
jgi:hypothetical protein